MDNDLMDADHRLSCLGTTEGYRNRCLNETTAEKRVREMRQRQYHKDSMGRYIPTAGEIPDCGILSSELRKEGVEPQGVDRHGVHAAIGKDAQRSGGIRQEGKNKRFHKNDNNRQTIAWHKADEWFRHSRTAETHHQPYTAKHRTQKGGEETEAQTDIG